MAEAYDLKFLNKSTEIKVEAAAAATSIDVDLTTGMAAEEAISIVLDDSSVHWDIIASVTDADTVVITSGIPAGRTSPVDATVKTYYAFMCRQQGQTKDWLVTDAPLLPQTLITESASPSNINPEREIQISQVDWRKGFQDYKLDDAYKYYESENTDPRFKGEVILSPKKLAAISISAPPTATLTDGGIEVWTGDTPDNWTETGDGVEDAAAPVHGGSHSAYVPDNAVGTIYQDISWDTEYKGKEFTFSAWGYRRATNSGVIKVQINDGVGESETTMGAGITTWTQASVTRTLDPMATQLRLIIDFDANKGGNDHMNIDDAALSQTSWDYSPIVEQIEFGDQLIVAADQDLFNLTTGSAVHLIGFKKTITDLCVFENRLYIAQGWSDAYWYTSDLSTFTESTLTGGETGRVTATKSAYNATATAIDVVDSSVYSAAGVYAQWENEIIEVDAIVDADTITAIRAQLGSTASQHATGTDITELASVTGAKYMSNVGGSQFWVSDTNSTMRDSDNPINNGTPFSSIYQIKSDDYDITGLVDHADTVFVRKEDDVYYLSGSDVLSLLDLNAEASTTYTYGLYLWGNTLYIASGVNSLYEYDIGAGTATVISPVRYAPGDANYDEEVLAICGDETYLYVAQDNGSDLKILAGRWETVDGETDWRWHPLYDYTSNDITSMLISSATGSKRLYIGTDTYTDGIIPFFVPVGYSQVYTESGFECESSGNFITPWYVSNFPTEDKFWKTADITSICVTAKTSIVPYYQIKGGSWVAMTTCTASALDGGNYPDETTDSRTIELSSERIRFKFAMAAADDDYTPILYGTGGGIVVYGVLQTERKRQIVATIQVAPHIKERNGSIIDTTVATHLGFLRILYQANNKETVIGPDDTEYSVLFARDGYNEQLAYDDELIRTEQWWCTVKLLEI